MPDVTCVRVSNAPSGPLPAGVRQAVCRLCGAAVYVSASSRQLVLAHGCGIVCRQCTPESSWLAMTLEQAAEAAAMDAMHRRN